MFPIFSNRWQGLVAGCLILAGAMPVRAEPGSVDTNTLVRATWDQLMNGSLDAQFVEVRGMIAAVRNMKDGWSVVNLRTAQGEFKAVLYRKGLTGGPVDDHLNAVVRVRGHLTVARDAVTMRLIAGQFRMRDAEIIVEQPAPAEPFSIPLKTTAALTRSDPDYDAFRWVKLAGQVMHVRSRVGFMMDGPDGVRFVGDKALEVAPGDQIEVVGYPGVLSAAAPVLYGAMIRRTGGGVLPPPKELSADELVRPNFDSTRVAVEGALLAVNQNTNEWVLEMRTGPWRYWAKVPRGADELARLQVGSRLRLTGTYCAQGEYKIMGPDVAAVDVLLNSAADLKVLATPPWWTPQRLTVLVGVLACLLLGIVVWVTQLQRLVRRRTAELGAEIHERQRIAHEHALEQERARIAQDLHDELGSGITEMGMLAARARSAAITTDKREEHLNEMQSRAGDMVTALDEIVWAMNPTHNSLGSLVSYCSLYADRFLGLANIRWHLETPTAPGEIAMDSHRRYQLFLAFKEALTNVVRHSGAKEVRMAMVAANGELRLTIIDDGRGLPAEGRGAEMYGLPNMQKRMEKLGGRCQISSPAEGGTAVEFVVPLN